MINIADVSFSVDVVLNMINKNMSSQLKQVDTSTKNISKNLQSQGTGFFGKDAVKIVDSQIQQTQTLTKQSQTYWNLRNSANKQAFQDTINIAKAQASLNEPTQGGINKFFDGVKANTPAVSNLNKQTKNLVQSLEQVSGIKNLDILPNESKLATSTKNLQGYVQNLELIEKAYGKGSPQARAYFKEVTDGADVSAKQLKTAQKNLAGFNFSFLSLIFGGMALKKIFGGAFKTLKEGYLEVADETDLFRKKTEGLADSFDLLKFTVFDAFANNPIVQSLIDGLTDSLTGLADFFERNPTLATTIVTLTGFLATIGTTLFVAGTAQQLFMKGGSFQAMSTVLKGMKGIMTADLVANTKNFFTNMSNIKAPAGNILSKITDFLQITGENAGKLTTLKLATAALVTVATIKILNKDGATIGERAMTVAGAALVGAQLGAYICTSIFPGLGTVAGATAGAIVLGATTAIINIADYKLDKQDKNQLFDLKTELQTNINDAFESGEFINTNILDEQIFLAINSIDRTKTKKKFNEAYSDIFSAKELGQLTESQYRSQLLALVGVVDKVGLIYQDNIESSFIDPTKKLYEDINNLSIETPELSVGSTLQGVEILKDLDVEAFKISLEEIKTPLSDFLSSFSGDEGLIIAVTNLLGATEGYVAYLPTLNDNLSTEGKNVDSLTIKYNKLAQAKREAGQTTRAEQASQTGQSTNYYQYTSNGGGQSTI